MALHTIKQNAEQKDKPAFLHFEKPNRKSLKKGYINVDFNDVLENIGAPQYDYESFKRAYDSDPEIEQYIENFNSRGIEINSESSESETDINKDKPDNGTVKKMAKAATNLDS